MVQCYWCCALVQERVLELETRVRTLVEEKERTEQGKSMSEKRLIELNTQLVRVLGFEASGPSEQAFDRVLVKVCTRASWFNRVFECLQCTLLHVYDSGDVVRAQVSEVIQENAMLKGKVVSMQAQMSELEKEHLQHRDTVQQLMRQIQGAPDLTEERRQLREARALTLDVHHYLTIVQYFVQSLKTQFRQNFLEIK